MLSGNCQAVQYLYRSGYQQGRHPLLQIWQHMTAKPKLLFFILEAKQHEKTQNNYWLANQPIDKHKRNKKETTRTKTKAKEKNKSTYFAATDLCNVLMCLLAWVQSGPDTSLVKSNFSFTRQYFFNHCWERKWYNVWLELGLVRCRAGVKFRV